MFTTADPEKNNTITGKQNFAREVLGFWKVLKQREKQEVSLDWEISVLGNESYPNECGYYSININSDKIMSEIQKAKSYSSVEQGLAKTGGHKT